MICPHCYRGRVVGSTMFGQGHNPPVELPEIMGLCKHCGGSGVAYCCDGAGENYGEVVVTVSKPFDPNVTVQFVWAEPDAEDLNGR